VRTQATTAAVYSSKIIKAGALLADTKTLLAHWDTAVSGRLNLDRLRRENVFGKVSRSRVEDVLAIFRRRFLSEQFVAKALVVLVRERLSSSVLIRFSSPIR
jgi:BrxA